MSKGKFFLLITATAVILAALINLTTYVPRNIINIDTDNVSKIHIINGTTGEEVEVTDTGDIHHIINNLNDIRFKKGKRATGYLGYVFDTTIYDKQGHELKNIIINSDDTIRYKNYFYTDSTSGIDFEFPESVFSTF